MAAVGRVFRSAVHGRRIGLVSRTSCGGCGAARCVAPTTATAMICRSLSTEGASLRKVFQSSAKESTAKGGRPKEEETVTDASRYSSSHTQTPKPTRAIVRGVTDVDSGCVAGNDGRAVGESEGKTADTSEGAQHTSSSGAGVSDSTPSSSASPLPFHQGNYMEFAPRITVVGCGGAGGNAVSNMIARNLKGVEFMVCNTDAQHLSTTLTDNRLQLGRSVTEGLGCGANPDAGRKAAEESKEEILKMIEGSHMVFIAAGMGGGTGTGAAPVIAEACMEAGILTVAVVTKPFHFEGSLRMRLAEEGLRFLASTVDTLIVIPNQNLFQMVDKQTSFLDSFRLADDVLLAGVRSVTDLMVNPGLINLDFADVQSVMAGMGNAMMGTGEAEGEGRAIRAAEDALSNPLLGELSAKTAKGLLVNITGGEDLTLFEVDEAASRVTDEVDDSSANIIVGSTYDSGLSGTMRVSVVATGIDGDHF
ncbi:unnamed protein product [Ectocarpus sp. CCAP 1310/34]|nr:unnamed protein product [Ectocarpus sp. CCAP 1310/34]